MVCHLRPCPVTYSPVVRIGAHSIAAGASHRGQRIYTQTPLYCSKIRRKECPKRSERLNAGPYRRPREVSCLYPRGTGSLAQGGRRASVSAMRAPVNGSNHAREASFVDPRGVAAGVFMHRGPPGFQNLEIGKPPPAVNLLKPKMIEPVAEQQKGGWR